jgi:hypothetical protein
MILSKRRARIGSTTLPARPSATPRAMSRPPIHRLPVNTKALFFSLALALGTSSLATPGDALAKGRAAPETFPMKATDFRKKIEARIDRVRAAIDKKLDAHGVSAERKAAIHRMIDESAKELRDALAQVSADGSVTEPEAAQVKKLALELRGKVRERMRAEKSGKGTKPKGDKPKSNAPKSNAPKSEKPKSDEPKGDTPKSEKPKSDEP